MAAVMAAAAWMKSLAQRVADAVGFDPTILISIFMTFMELLKNCKKPASKAEALAMVDDEYAAMFGDVDDDEERKRRRRDEEHKCPMLFRMACRQHKVKDRDDQEALYVQYVAESKQDRDKLAALMAA